MNPKAKAAVPRWIISLVAAAAASTCLASLALAKPEKQVAPDPGRTTPVHNIPLFNAEGAPIDPSAKTAKPISQKVSCGKCHDYEIIERGWHFNTGDANVPPGRAGEPWVLADLATGTQIPISPRGWKGSYRPAQIGMSSWVYVDKFGRQMPGGDYGERFTDKLDDPATDRWGATGNLSINCLGCHSCDFRQNQDEWAKNIERGNYLEAATAASGLGHVLGYVNKLRDFDRVNNPEAPDAPQFVPSVIFERTRFGYKDSAFVDVAGAKLPNNRCYHCHSTHRIDMQEFQTQEDVHMARGLSCVACHRNGVNHQISRNYEGETGRAEGYSCRGCHLGQSEAMTAELKKGGFGAAPRPAHKGIPQLHLDKLTCTACHSGPVPSAEPKMVMTARIHALGVHGTPHDPKMPPLVLEPVFVKQADGKIAPCRMVFPAFFGRLKDGKVTPMLPSAVIEATGDLLATPAGKAPAAPTPEKIAVALKALGAGKDGQAVYVGGSKLWKLDGEKLAASADPAAEPYAWPIAHDVRPASQSLGAGGACTDCHAADSAFLFGKVPPITPAALGEPAEMQMNHYTGMAPTYYKLFGVTFIFRPYLKCFGFAVSGIVLLILLAFGLPGIASVLKRRCGRTR